MKYIKGDLIKLSKEGNFDAMVYGCNCFCTMGAGIAKQVKEIFPKAYEVDKKTKKGDRNKLGTYTKAEIILQIPDNKGYKTHYLDVINAYTQYDYRRHNDENPCDYGAIEKVFSQINHDYKGKKIGIPMIGAGLAGGDWFTIEDIVKRVTSDINIVVVEWDGVF